MHRVVSDVNTPKILQPFEAPTKNGLLHIWIQGKAPALTEISKTRRENPFVVSPH